MRKLLIAVAIGATTTFANAQPAPAEHDYNLSQQDIVVIVNSLQQNKGILETQLLQKLQGEVNAFAAADAKKAAPAAADKKK